MNGPEIILGVAVLAMVVLVALGGLSAVRNENVRDRHRDENNARSCWCSLCARKREQVNTTRLSILVALILLAPFPSWGEQRQRRLRATTGTVIAPGEDINALVAAAPAGTTFTLQAGVHRLQSISPKDGNSFIGESGTVLSGARLLTSFTPSGSNWVTSGQTQEGAIVGSCRTGFLRCNRPEELFIDNLRMQHVSTLMEVGSGKWHFDYPNDLIYIGNDPAGHTVETSVTTTAFHPSANNVTIVGLVVEKYANLAQSGAITSWSKSGWTITGNEVRLNHGYGIQIGPSAQVRQNNVHHNGQLGIGGIGDDVLVEDNEIAYNNAAQFDSWWEAGGTKFVLTHDLVVRGNFIHHNDGPGLWTDIDNIDTIHEGNTVEDNVGPGIFHEISYQAIIRNNIVKRNGFGGEYEVWAWGAGILVSASRDVEVYGNTVEDNGDGIMAIQQDRGTGTYGAWEVVNLWVHNNMIVNSTGWSGGLAIDLETYDDSYFTSMKNNDWNNNQYTLGPDPLPFVWQDDEISRIAWQAAGQDASSTFD